jgi:dTDP-4-amino-4,6-dideoxygalactose transaminase
VSFYYKIPICGTSWSAAEYGDCIVGFKGNPAAELTTFIAAQFGSRPALFNSGRSALEMAFSRIAALTAARGSKSVLVPSFVCAAVPRKIMRSGMRPVFYDITSEIQPSARSAEQAMQPDTVAVVHPYLYGNVGGITEMASFAEQNGLYLVEDCAAAFLLKDGSGELAGARGDFVVFSFQEGKTIVAGSGGALIDRTSAEPVLPRSWSWAQQRRLELSKLSFFVRKVEKSIGYAIERVVGKLGGSFADRLQEEVYSMAAIDARLVLRQISRWPELYARKVATIDRYARNLAGSGLHLPQVQKGGYVGRLFVEYPEPVVERRPSGRYESVVARALQSKGVQTQLPYYPAHLLPEFAETCGGRTLPCADRLYRSLIEVPTQARLRADQIDYVCECLLQTAKVSRAVAPAAS